MGGDGLEVLNRKHNRSAGYAVHTHQFASRRVQSGHLHLERIFVLARNSDCFADDAIWKVLPEQKPFDWFGPVRSV
jgi:hypothetical protein